MRLDKTERLGSRSCENGLILSILLWRVSEFTAWLACLLNFVYVIIGYLVAFILFQSVVRNNYKAPDLWGFGVLGA